MCFLTTAIILGTAYIHICCCSATKLCPSLCLDTSKVVSKSLCPTPWTAARLVSLSSTVYWSLLTFVFIESGMVSNHFILCHPVLLFSFQIYFLLSFCLQSFPASGSFSMSWLFASGGWSTGASASASVLPMDIQGWLPLGLTGWISLQSRGLSSIFSSTTIWKHQFFGTRLSL